MILNYILYLPFDLLMKVVGALLAPTTSLFVDKKGNLPKWLYWFQTPDSNMFGYLGDRDFYEDHKDQTNTFFGRWWVCTLWQWRNTSQGFSTFVLGVNDRNRVLETVWENENIYLKKIKGLAFDFKGSLKYPFINYRLRWRFGWKLHQDLNYPAQYVFSISPFITL